MADDTRQDERAVTEDGPGPTHRGTVADASTDVVPAVTGGGAPDDGTTTTDRPAGDGPAEDDGAGDAASAEDRPDGARRRTRRSRGARGDRPATGRTTTSEGRGRAVLPLVPVLAGLLVVLLAGTVYLFLTRPASSSVRTADYVDALQAARAGIVDVASFDYLTLDDDIAQIRSVTTGDLQTESVEQLDSRRQDITDTQAVVNTEVVGAAVGAADDGTATVYMVIQSTQTTTASDQAQVQRYRIEVDLTKDGDRWLLSGITGR